MPPPGGEAAAGRDGRRRQVKRRGFATKREAHEALDELRGHVGGGRSVGAARMTFGEFLRDRWLPHLEGDERLKPTTKSSYRNAVRHLVAHAGRVRLADLRGDDLDRVSTALADRSPSLRHAVHITAHKALGDAVRWRLVAHNVAADATPPPQRRASPAAWTPAEVGRFLGEAERDRWWPLWRVAATTGMRRGELVGLRWSAVDLERHELTVAESLTVAGGRTHRGSTKTDRARTIRLDPTTVAVLRTWRATQAAEMLVLGEYRPDHDHLFTWPDGSTVHPDIVTRTFGRVARRAGVPPLRLHALRHAWATNALAAGVHVKDVSHRLGHSSVLVTLDVYTSQRRARRCRCQAGGGAVRGGSVRRSRGHAVVTEAPSPGGTNGDSTTDRA